MSDGLCDSVRKYRSGRVVLIKKINLLESARREICERKLILGNCHLFTNLRRKNIPLKCNQCDHDFATNMTLMKRKKAEQGL